MTRFEFSTDPAVVVLQISTASLGDHSYVVGVGGRGLVIDPQRDVGRFEQALAAEGLSLEAVFETHIHNDYISGGAVLAGRHEALYVLPAGSGASVDHTALGDGEEYSLGEWRVRALHTPGHTPHHLSYALVGPDGPVALFSGGSMLVGAVGRSDLLGPEHTDTLIRQQFASVRGLAEQLPDPTRVGPTHGAGSFCSASAVLETTTTIGRERLQNPALLAADVEEFARTQLAGYRLFPAYYAHMGPANLSGVGPIRGDEPVMLDTTDLARMIEAGDPVIDLRPAVEWAAGHIPGTVNIPMSNDVGTYIGWLFPWNRPVALLGSPIQCSEAILQLGRIGHDAVAGCAADAEAQWIEDGGNLAAVRAVSFRDLAAEQPEHILDVRDPGEVAEAGAVDGALNIHVSALRSSMDLIAPGTVWVLCASGYRASIAAGLLEAAGRNPVLVLDGFERYQEAAATAP